MNFLFKKSFYIAVVLLIGSFLFIRSQYVSRTDFNARAANRGDGYSDNNTISAVKYFYDHGLWKTKLRTMHKYKDPMAPNQEAVAYTHYPAFPDLILSLWAKTIHSTEEHLLRIFPLAISLLWLFMLWLFMHKICLNSTQARLGFVLLALSGYYVLWADNLHKHMWEELFKITFVLGLYNYYQSKRNFWIIIGLAALAIFTANASFEPIVFIAVIVLSFSIINEKKFYHAFISKEAWLLGFAFVLGFTLHMYFNSLYFGSWQAAIADMQGALQHRTASCASSNCQMNWLDYLKLPLTALSRLERYFLIPGPALLFFSYLSLKKLKQVDVYKYKVCIGLLVASFAWYVVMRQHAMVHHFVAKHGGIFWGAMMGIGITQYYDIYLKNWSKLSVQAKTLNIIFVSYIGIMAISQQFLQIYWQSAFVFLFK